MDGLCGRVSVCKHFLSKVARTGCIHFPKWTPSWRPSWSRQSLWAPCWWSGVMTLPSDWKGSECDFLFASDKIKPLSVLHLFLRRLFSELFRAWSLFQYQGRVLSCHNYRSVHHQTSVQSPWTLSRENDFSGSSLSSGMLPSPKRRCFKHPFDYRELPASTDPGTEGFSRSCHLHEANTHHQS